MHHFTMTEPRKANFQKQLDELDQMVAEADGKYNIGQTNIFDNIWAPVIIFAIFTLIGFFVGYIQFERRHSQRLDDYNANRMRRRIDKRLEQTPV